MQILNQLETEPIPIEEEEKRHARRLLVGVLCALILTGSVLGGLHKGQAPLKRDRIEDKGCHKDL